MFFFYYSDRLVDKLSVKTVVRQTHIGLKIILQHNILYVNIRPQTNIVKRNTQIEMFSTI